MLTDKASTPAPVEIGFLRFLRSEKNTGVLKSLSSSPGARSGSGLRTGAAAVKTPERLKNNGELFAFANLMAFAC